MNEFSIDKDFRLQLSTYPQDHVLYQLFPYGWRIMAISLYGIGEM